MNNVIKTIKNFATVFASVFAYCAASLTLASDDITIIHAGHLLATVGDPMLERQSLVIEGGKIKSVHAGFLQAKDIGIGEARVIDLSSQYVLPGLIDAHAHLTVPEHADGLNFYLNSFVAVRGEEAAMVGYANALKLMQAGFTTIRSVGSYNLAVPAVRDAIKKGMLPGPRVLASTSPMSVSGGADDIHGFRPDVMAQSTPDGVCDGADGCRKAVRLLVKHGADVIKVVTTRWFEPAERRWFGPEELSKQPLEFTRAELQAIVDEAHRLGRKVAAHADSAEAINAALRAGVDSIEHGTSPNKESLRLYKKHNAFWVPTLGTYTKPHGVVSPTAEDYKTRLGSDDHLVKMLAEAQRQGIKVVTGLDGISYAPGQGAIELALLVKVGFSEMEAIAAATVNAAELLGLDDQIGSLVAGKAADIVAVDENPLENIEVLLDMNFVMRDGKVYKIGGASNGVPLL